MPSDPVGEAAATLLQARSTRDWLASFPEACRPQSLAECYAIQGRVLAEIGPIAAWKVGARTPEAQPSCAPIATATLFESGAKLPAAMFHLVGIEAEIAYRLSADLAPREREYALDEVIAAIGSIHPAIEVADTRFMAWGSQDRFSHLADQLNHGALIVGTARTDWRSLQVTSLKTTLSIDGRIAAEVVGGNPGGDPLRLLTWLANVGARPFGGLRAGAVVTTGSVSGIRFVTTPTGAAVQVAGVWSVDVTIGQER